MAALATYYAMATNYKCKSFICLTPGRKKKAKSDPRENPTAQMLTNTDLVLML